VPERPVKNKVRKQHFEQILRELEYIFESETKKDRLSVFIEKWNKLYRYFNNLRGKIDNYTYFFKYSRKLRSYFSTTNWIERCFKEIKDNIRIRWYFHSEESANKFLYIFFRDKNLKYQRKLRYLNIFEEAFNE
jgi:transposase-like protein